MAGGDLSKSSLMNLYVCSLLPPTSKLSQMSLREDQYAHWCLQGQDITFANNSAKSQGLYSIRYNISKLQGERGLCVCVWGGSK